MNTLISFPFHLVLIHSVHLYFRISLILWNVMCTSRSFKWFLFEQHGSEITLWHFTGSWVAIEEVFLELGRHQIPWLINRFSLCLLALQVSMNSAGRRRSSSGVIKVSLEENVTDVEACASEKSESGTVRHVDSGVVMDGEWGKTDDIVCLRPCCHSGGLPLVLTSQYQRANWSLFTLLQWSDLEWGPRETWV